MQRTPEHKEQTKGIMQYQMSNQSTGKILIGQDGLRTWSA